MDCSYYLQNYTPIPEKLRAYGFCEQNGDWILERDLPFKDLFVKVRLGALQFDLRVIDRNFNDDFLPFSVKDGNSPVKAVVNDLLADILATCFENARRDVIAYCEQTFGTPFTKPWAKFPDFGILRNLHSQKWYAVIMKIPRSKIGLDGDATVDVINIKLPTDQIQSLIDGQYYFNAYHMNKKYWLTILLDQNTNMSQLKTLLTTSYNLVEK